jgi:hypothetical protein
LFVLASSRCYGSAPLQDIRISLVRVQPLITNLGRGACLLPAMGPLLAFAICQHASAAETGVPLSDSQISIHDEFVDEERCVSCHAGEAEAFAKSNHAKAMAVANDSTVRESEKARDYKRGCNQVAQAHCDNPVLMRLGLQSEPAACVGGSS